MEGPYLMFYSVNQMRLREFFRITAAACRALLFGIEIIFIIGLVQVLVLTH